MIIGVSGYARSGKDTLAEELVAKNGFKRFAFADTIKDALYRLNPMVAGSMRVQTLIDATSWEQAKEDYPELRLLLQRFGAEVGREMFGPNFWVRQTMHRVEKAQDASRVVISDVRYPNEAEAIKALGGQIWRVERPLFKPVNSHGSEGAMDNWSFDKTLLNNGTVKDFRSLVTLEMLQYV